jgi:hypothetical protein
MGDGRVRAIAGNTTVVGSPATNAETVVATSNPIKTDGPGRTILLQGVINVTAGTSAVAAVLKIRRGLTTGGAQVGTSVTQVVIATDGYNIPFLVTDSPGDVDSIQYSATLTMTSGAATSTVNVVFIGGSIY